MRIFSFFILFLKLLIFFWSKSIYLHKNVIILFGIKLFSFRIHSACIIIYFSCIIFKINNLPTVNKIADCVTYNPKILVIESCVLWSHIWRFISIQNTDHLKLITPMCSELLRKIVYSINPFPHRCLLSLISHHQIVEIQL